MIKIRASLKTSLSQKDARHEWHSVKGSYRGMERCGCKEFKERGPSIPQHAAKPLGFESSPEPPHLRGRSLRASDVMHTTTSAR